MDLKNQFMGHLKEMDIEITEERINSIYAMGEYFALMVNEKMYEATSIIIATGIEYTKPMKGEEEFLGKGVGYLSLIHIWQLFHLLLYYLIVILEFWF